MLASSYIHPTKDKERDNQLRLADTELDSDGDNQQKVNPLLVWPRGQAAGFQDWRKAQDGKVSEGSIHSTWHGSYQNYQLLYQPKCQPGTMEAQDVSRSGRLRVRWHTFLTHLCRNSGPYYYVDRASAPKNNPSMNGTLAWVAAEGTVCESWKLWRAPYLLACWNGRLKTSCMSRLYMLCTCCHDS